VPPFTIGNVAHCQGTTTEIPGESPMDLWLLLVDKINIYDTDARRERAEFITTQLSAYDIYADVLSGSLYLPDGEADALRKYKYIKKMC